MNFIKYGIDGLPHLDKYLNAIILKYGEDKA